MPPPTMAVAYLVPARSISLTGAPGARLDFRSGRCVIQDARLIPIALRMPNVTLIPEPRYEGHLPQWLDGCGELQPARAKVALQDGSVLSPPEYAPPDYSV